MQRVIGRLAGHRVDISPYIRRRDLLCQRLAAMGYELRKPEGTFYLFPQAPGGDDMAFIKALQKELILAVPGSGFGAPGYFRIAFCVNEGVIERSMDGFEKVIKESLS